MPWFQFKNLYGGMQSAEVRARLELSGQKSRTIDFLVDSGASLSLVPFAYVSHILKGDTGEDVNLGLEDAHGKQIRGKKIELRVHLVDAPDFTVTTETFGVGNVKWPVLGLSWFRTVGVHFRNFDHSWQGRSFAVYNPSSYTRSKR